MMRLQLIMVGGDVLTFHDLDESHIRDIKKWYTESSEVGFLTLPRRAALYIRGSGDVQTLFGDWTLSRTQIAGLSSCEEEAWQQFKSTLVAEKKKQAGTE